MRLRLAWATDAGLRREHNEDSVFVAQRVGKLDALLVVADGMGGHASGQVASRIVAETVADEMKGPGGIAGAQLARALAQANTAVFEAAKSKPEHAGMGSTLVVAAIKDGRLGLLNVGDSPAYLVRGGTVTEIYQNHNWPSEQARAGIITPDEARTHPMKHRLARAVGVWDEVKGYTNELELERGDTVLLCSDGVEEASVGVDELRRIMEGPDLQGACDHLIEVCRERGAPDNVTIAAARLG
jgi:serine/threonine protein phosphatase PrpC